MSNVVYFCHLLFTGKILNRGRKVSSPQNGGLHFLISESSKSGKSTCLNRDIFLTGGNRKIKRVKRDQVTFGSKGICTYSVHTPLRTTSTGKTFTLKISLWRTEFHSSHMLKQFALSEVYVRHSERLFS